MFGSNDDKKTPAPAGEKKGLFGWLRKKTQETPTEPAQDVSTTVSPIIKPAVEHAEPVLAPQPAPEQVQPGTPVEQPWLQLPVAEEPVALIDEQAPHVTPPIAPTDSAQAPPVLLPEAALVPEVEPARVDESIAELDSTLVIDEPLHEPKPAVPAMAAPAPAVSLPVAPIIEPAVPAVTAPAAQPEATRAGFFARLKQGLSKTSASIGEGMASLFLGKKVIDDDLLEEIETRLLTADVGVEATGVIIQSLTQKVARKQLTDAQALYTSLQGELSALLKPVEQPLIIDVSRKPFVILVVGVNGAGKTTTIGKLAKKLQLEGKKVMLAAGDTFRAAAVEQLQVWGDRNKIPVIAQHTGADSASVIFDAVQAAKARGIDVLIADTAGRLHTKDNLMEELKKVRRVMGKLDADAPHEVLLVLDAGTGQNAIAQAKQFHQTVALTGLALTKLDGTAKGGVIFALAKQFGLPIRYIGVGEGIDDLRTFEAEPFVQALFAERERP
jgi:fused signal recognition particle receptor